MKATETTHIELWPIDKLIFYARNPDAAVGRMEASIREFGFKIPVLARSSGEVVDGHLRLEAARKLGITEIPVILCDEWSEAQVKAFRLMVNRSVAWADWDEDLLSQELIDLKDLDFDLGLTGFDDEELARLLAAQDAAAGICDEDAAPALPQSLAARAASAAMGDGSFDIHVSREFAPVLESASEALFADPNNFGSDTLPVAHAAPHKHAIH